MIIIEKSSTKRNMAAYLFDVMNAKEGSKRTFPIANMGRFPSSAPSAGEKG
jgi:hypothetical protein